MFRKAASMRVVRWFGLAAAAAMLLTLAACNGGGGVTQIVIVNINTNPVVVAAGSTVELSASISAPGRTLSSLSRYWTVSDGSLSADQPDFTLTERAMSQTDDFADDLLTTNSTVYWQVPATTGPVTITLDVEDAHKSATFTVTTSQVALSVTDGGDGKKVCAVQVSGITDLYQAAFRINYSSAWKPISAEPGDFLGGASDILWLGLTNQSGFVPCAITRKGSAAGVDGSGTLATVTFEPVGGASAVSDTASLPFEVNMVQLRDAEGELISPAS